MWVVKFSFNGEGILYGKTAKICGGEIRGYNLSKEFKTNKLIVTSAGRFLSDEKSIKKAVNFLRKDNHVLNLEENNGFFIITLIEDKEFYNFYSSNFIYVSPVSISSKGIYEFHIASWYRKDIENLLNKVEKLKDFKLKLFRQERIQNISITGLQPNLTKKQKQAYDLAVNEGYYEYPKKTTLHKLSTILGISYSTFQQHLSYAERKLSSFFTGKFNTD